MGQTSNNFDPDNGDYPDPEEADFIMECMLTRYVMQNRIIKSKLHHVQTATRQRMSDIEKIVAKEEALAQKLNELKKTKMLDGLWQQLIDLLQEIGLSEEDIDNIDDAVTSTPSHIRKYYDILVEQDRDLSNLIYEINSENFVSAYTEAHEITTKIQKRPNEMSGLGPEEYEPQKEHVISTSGFEIITLPNLRSRR